MERERPAVRSGNLRFHLRFLLDGVEVPGRRVLEVGAGDGVLALYLACAGAQRVVALEPEAAGSSAGARRRFERLAGQLGVRSAELLPQTLQAYYPGEERFDIVCLQASINHLDEEACAALHRDPGARDAYRPLLAKLAAVSAPGARLIVSDCSRHNLFARLPITNPLARTIEWEKHQPPRLWSSLLEEVGFSDPKVRWFSFNTLRSPGRALLGNRVAAWFLTSAFCLTMTKRGGGERFRRAASSPATRAVPGRPPAAPARD